MLFLRYLVFSLIPIASRFDGNVFDCCFSLGGNKVFILVIRSMSVRYLLKRIKLGSLSYSKNHIFDITIGEFEPVML